LFRSSPTITSAAARQVEMNESSVRVARMTLTRSGTADGKRGGDITRAEILSAECDGRAITGRSDDRPRHLELSYEAPDRGPGNSYRLFRNAASAARSDGARLSNPRRRRAASLP